MNRDRIEGTLQDAAGKFQQALGMATGGAGRRGEGMVREVAGKGQRFYGQARDEIDGVADAAHDAGDRLSRHGSDAYDRVRQGSGSLRSEIERHPFTSILLVGALGYALGLLSSNAGR